MKFYIVDAFTEKTFGGNPAGVVILPQEKEFPSKEIMISTAAELRYSETAFVKQLSKDLFQIRYFTPVEEVDLCGHATIATFHALLKDGIVQNNSLSYIETLAGKLAIEIENHTIWMEMGAPEAIKKIDDSEALKELYQVMGLDYFTAKSSLFPELVSTGLPDIILPVLTREDLDSIKPDFQALSQLSEKYQAVGVHAFVLPNCNIHQSNLDAISTYTTQCRNFAPLYGINEEAATGTSNGALTYFLYKNGILKEGMQSTFVQGEAMNRPSKIHTKFVVESALERDSLGSNIKIQVGGTGVILAQGEILI